MAEQSAQERTEDPTPKRLLDARKKGQVPRSKEFNTLISLLAGGAGAWMFGPMMIEATLDVLRLGLMQPARLAFDDQAPAILLHNAMISSVLLLAPIMALLFVASLAAPMAMGGWSMSADAITPKFERIDPVKGLGRIFAVRSLMELAKTILKFLLVAAVAALTLWQLHDWLLGLSVSPLLMSLPAIGGKFVTVFLLLSAAMIFVALIDVPFQLWDHTRQLRMTRQEVKDEMKETDGRPEVKAHIRGMQQQAAQQRMMLDVPSADVVITNPTHFAVALRYTDGEMNAPVVVAKGKDLVAAQIREIAIDNEITLFSAPPLARALYAASEIGQEIPERLFVTVARVLAYVFQLRQAGGLSSTIKPPSDESLLPPEDD